LENVQLVSARTEGRVSKPKNYLGVMVSSTFTDLREHRQALINLIHTHDLFPVDMEHGGGAQAEDDVLASSLKMVRDAAAYVCIISRRYGQIPGDPDRNPDGLSLTELEFNEALRLKRPILLFLMADDHPAAENDIEQAALHNDRLDAFRQRARLWREGTRVERVYQEFGSLADFSQKAGIAVPRLKAWLEQHRPAKPTYPPPDVIYLVDRRNQLRDLRRERSSLDHGIVVCTVQGNVADEPIALNRSLMSYLAPTLQESGRLFPIAEWPPDNGSSDTEADQDFMWEGLREQLPACRFDPSRRRKNGSGEAWADAELDALSDSISLVDGVRYLIPLPSTMQVSVGATLLLRRELQLWHALAERRRQVLAERRRQLKDLPPQKTFGVFLVLVCFIAYQAGPTAASEGGVRGLLGVRRARRRGVGVEALTKQLKDEFRALPLLVLSPLTAVGPDDVPYWAQDMARRKLVEHGHIEFLSSRFVRTVLRNGPKSYSDMLEEYERQEHSIWTRQDQ
jgi:hypothetical protein